MQWYLTEGVTVVFVTGARGDISLASLTRVGELSVAGQVTVTSTNSGTATARGAAIAPGIPFHPQTRNW